ncbi:MAG: hypothetical protein ACIARR_03240 [Phycisphaerales bacterium JB059]
MGASETNSTGRGESPGAEHRSPCAGVRVLLVTSRSGVQRRLVKLLGKRVDVLSVSKTVLDARKRLSKGLHDLALIDSGIGGGIGCELAQEISLSSPGTVSAMLSDEADLDEAMHAMRAGATDLIALSVSDDDMLSRLEAACERAGRQREREARVSRLRRLCHQLNSARKEVSGHVGDLCNDLVEAYRELSDQFEDVSVSAELTSLLRQELDVESLLRTLLEYTLAKVGSTNAAIFLPSTSGEFSLGAYVNYDCPKDSAEVMMDHLANVMAPRFEHQDRVLAMSGSADLERYLGEDAHWLGESAAMVIACREDDECLAVITLFRDKRTPFGENDVKMLSIIAEHFGSQLSRVIHVHHRHLPKDQWGGFETDLDDEDDGFGDIDLAA